MCVISNIHVMNSTIHDFPLPDQPQLFPSLCPFRMPDRPIPEPKLTSRLSLNHLESTTCVALPNIIPAWSPAHVVTISIHAYTITVIYKHLTNNYHSANRSSSV